MNISDYDKDPNRARQIPEIEGALILAKKLSEHCEKHKLPDDLVLYGVAIDVGTIKQKAYDRGYEAGILKERERIAKVLGF